MGHEKEMQLTRQSSEMLTGMKSDSVMLQEEINLKSKARTFKQVFVLNNCISTTGTSQPKRHIFYRGPPVMLFDCYMKETSNRVHKFNKVGLAFQCHVALMQSEVDTTVMLTPQHEWNTQLEQVRTHQTNQLVLVCVELTNQSEGSDQLKSPMLRDEKMVANPVYERDMAWVPDRESNDDDPIIFKKEPCTSSSIGSSQQPEW